MLDRTQKTTKHQKINVEHYVRFGQGQTKAVAFLEACVVPCMENLENKCCYMLRELAP